MDPKPLWTGVPFAPQGVRRWRRGQCRDRIPSAAFILDDASGLIPRPIHGAAHQDWAGLIARGGRGADVGGGSPSKMEVSTYREDISSIPRAHF